MLSLSSVHTRTCPRVRSGHLLRGTCAWGLVFRQFWLASYRSSRLLSSSPPPRLPSTPQCTAEVEEIRAFFAGAKMLIVSYDLPVKLYLKPCPSGPAGAPVWVAEWNEQAVHARSSGASIADEMPTLWIGCVTNQVRGGTWVMHTWLHVARLGSSQLPSLFAQLHSRTTLFAALCVSPRAFAR